MPLIGLTGPNAIGKTQALRRWVSRYAKLVGASRDGGTLLLLDGAETRDRDWAGKEPAVQAQVEKYRQAYSSRVCD